MYENVNNSVMGPVGVSRMKKTSVVIVEPDAKVNNKYYCDHFLVRGFMPLFKRHVVAITRHYVRTELISHSQKYGQLSSSGECYFELDKWQPNSFDFKLVD